MASVKQLAHLCIHSRDLDATRSFYVDALGLEPGFDFLKDGRRFGYYLKFGQNTFIEVFEGDPGEVGNINHLAIEVEDMDGVIERVRKAGHTVGDKKLGPDQSWQAWLEDPNGIRIELHEYTSDSSQLSGKPCRLDG